MIKALCIVFSIFTMVVMFTIPTSSQLETDCVFGYLEQIIAVAQTGNNSALDTIPEIVRNAKLKCTTDAGIIMLYPNEEHVRLGESDCSVAFGYQRDNSPQVLVSYLAFSEDLWFAELWRNDVALDYETQSLVSEHGVNVFGQIYFSEDLIDGLYRLSIENFDGSYHVVYGIEMTRPGLYLIQIACGLISVR